MIAVLGRALIDHQGTRKNKKPREFPRRTVRKPKTENQKTENRNKEPPEFQQVFWVVLRRQAGDNVPFGQMFVLDQCVDQGSQHGGHGVHRGIGRDFVGGIVVKAAVLQHQPTFAFDVVDTVGEGGLPGKRERREEGREEERKKR